MSLMIGKESCILDMVSSRMVYWGKTIGIMVDGGIQEYYQYCFLILNNWKNRGSKISTAILGTAQLGQVYGITNQEGLLTKKQSLEILETAWNNNIKIFDTAPNYNSEKIIGDFVKTHSLERGFYFLVSYIQIHQCSIF